MGRLEDGVFRGIRHKRTSVPAEDGVLVRILEREFRARNKSTYGSGGGRDVGAASRPVTGLEDGQEVMQTTTNQDFTARPARGVRLLEHAGRATYAGPYRTPVLPRGWAPLTTDSQRAVRIALDFFNSDLQARGETWRLGVEVPAVPPGDPRRV